MLVLLNTPKAKYAKFYSSMYVEYGSSLGKL